MKKPKIKGLSHGAYCTANISQSIKLNKARERVIKAAKKWRRTVDATDGFNSNEEADLCELIDALMNLESK